MTRFNLTDEPWIPCLFTDGHFEEVSLRDALLRSREIREVYDQSPLITAALYRLLLAVVHHMTDLRDEAGWLRLWNAERLDPAHVRAYFDQYKDRFDLFHPERPFYQVPRMDDAEVHPIQRLAQEAASGNNATLFDHSYTANPVPMPAARAACYLVAAQAFSIGGGVSKPFNLTDAPLARGYVVMALGEDLFETLMLNLVPRPDGIRYSTDDAPIWAQDAPTVPDKAGTREKGYLDYLTWQSRRIHLIPEGNPAVVRLCQVQQNLRLRADVLDPFKPYRKEKQGWIPLRLDPARAMWRDAHALLELETTATGEKAPEVMRWLATLERMRWRGDLDLHPVKRLAVMGLATEPGRATAVLWRQERMPLPLAYLRERRLVDALEVAVALAEQVEGVLKGAVEQFIRTLMNPEKKETPPPVRTLVGRMTPSEDYWSRLEHPFRQLMGTLPEDEEAAQAQWVRDLRRAAEVAFTLAVSNTGDSGRVLRATAAAERRFKGGLKRVLNDWEEVTTDESAD